MSPYYSVYGFFQDLALEEASMRHIVDVVEDVVEGDDGRHTLQRGMEGWVRVEGEPLTRKTFTICSVLVKTCYRVKVMDDRHQTRARDVSAGLNQYLRYWMGKNLSGRVNYRDGYGNFLETGVSGAELGQHGIALYEVKGTTHSVHRDAFSVVKDCSYRAGHKSCESFVLSLALGADCL